MVNSDRDRMIDEQLVARGIKNERVLEAFRKVPRDSFVPDEYKRFAYDDRPLPIGEGQTISQPYVVALMLELLNPRKKDRVLEIGAGSGYVVALLSYMCREVLGLETVPLLAKRACEVITRLDISNAQVLKGDGKNFTDDEKYQRILVSAATLGIPDNWKNILEEDGILLLPEGDSFSQALNKYQKKDGRLELIESSIGVIFVPLT